jgi:hypothetical protein
LAFPDRCLFRIPKVASFVRAHRPSLRPATRGVPSKAHTACRNRRLASPTGGPTYRSKRRSRSGARSAAEDRSRCRHRTDHPVSASARSR